MAKTMPVRYIAITVALLPFLAANLSYIFSASQGFVEWCNPYLDGCTSISRAGRHGIAYFVFKGLMIPAAVLMMVYWYINYQWLTFMQSRYKKVQRLILVMGFIAPLGLIVYSCVLGSVGDVYFTLRRIGVIIYFSLTFFAQLLLTYCVSKLDNISLRSAYRVYFLICLAMWGLGLVHLAFEILRPEFDTIDDIIEWNFALLTTLFYLSSYWIWRYGDMRVELKQSI